MSSRVYGQELSRSMNSFDFSPVIGTLLQRSVAKSKEEAADLVDAFLQWIAMVPAIEAGNVYIMLNTPVDEAFHAFIEHREQYDAFCKTFLGFVVQHHPIEAHRGLDLAGGVRYTVGLLEGHYGSALHPLLKQWRHQLDNGCAVVSCSSCDSLTVRDQTVVGALPDGRLMVH